MESWPPRILWFQLVQLIRRRLAKKVNSFYQIQSNKIDSKEIRVQGDGMNAVWTVRHTNEHTPKLECTNGYWNEKN